MEGIKNLFNKCKELLGASSSDMKALGKELEKETNMIRNLHIRELHQLQQLVPEVIITGSSALFLHGIKLKRWMKTGQVSKLEHIIMAKLKYGRGNPKHITDLYEMTGKLIPIDVPEKKEPIDRGGS